MYFLIEDDELLEKYNSIWDKVRADIKKFDSQSVYKKKYLKTKIKLHADKHWKLNFMSIIKVKLCG